MRGATLTELLVGLTLALVVSAIASRVLVESGHALAWQPTAGELSARADAVARLLTAEIGAAGAGPRLPLDPGGGPAPLPDTHRLAAWLPPILPRVVAIDDPDADDVAAVDRISILTIADGAAQVRVRRAPPRWLFEPGPTCPALVAGCGVRAGVPLLLLGRGPGFQLGVAEAVDAAGVELAGTSAGDPEATMAAVEIVSYRFDPVRGELLRGRAAGRGLPVADHITAFAVELWGDGRAPRGPRWPAEDTCVTGADGTPRLRDLAPPDAPPIRLDPAMLSDGPWCGVAPFRVDADLFRVRRVRVRMRFEADSDGARGRDAARFARAGRASGPSDEVADLDLTLDVAPASLRGES